MLVHRKCERQEDCGVTIQAPHGPVRNAHPVGAATAGGWVGPSTRYTPWQPLSWWHWRYWVQDKRWWRRDFRLHWGSRRQIIGVVEFRSDREMAHAAFRDLVGVTERE